MSTSTYRAGDVVTYTPENRWCREGMAIANSDGILFDTFWITSGDAHRLTTEEVATAELVFNLNDYRELPHAERYTWVEYHPEARQRITHQHGLQFRYFVLPDAKPDLDTMVENAKGRVAEAEDELRRAQRQVEWRKEELAQVEQRRAAARTQS